MQYGLAYNSKATFVFQLFLVRSIRLTLFFAYDYTGKVIQLQVIIR